MVDLRSGPLRALRARLRTIVGGGVEEDALFWSLDAPSWASFDPASPQRFRGIAIHVGGRRVVSLRVAFDGAEVGSFPIDVDRTDLAPFLAGLPFPSLCGYDAELPPSGGARRIAFDAVLDDGTAERLFEYDTREAAEARSLAEGLAGRRDALPVPPPELVALTQGISDPAAYAASILPGVLNLRKYLAAAGVDETRLRSLLDFGCGSGRLLAGWRHLGPDRLLRGCDIREELVAWASRSFPPDVDIRLSGPEPPLPWGDSTFDLAYAVSVFTHLSVASQKAWQRELARVLRPGAAFVVTLHGSLYVRLLCAGDPSAVRRFSTEGHLERGNADEGSNDWASFHGPRWAEEVFESFRLLAHFPSGRIGGRRVLFPVASLQDVYVFRRR